MFGLTQLSDEQLLAFIRQGGTKEERAIKLLLKRNGGSIKAFVLGNGGNEADADETLYAAITALIFNVRKGKFKGDSALDTYLYAIAKRIWYKSFSKLRKAEEKHESWGELQTEEHDLPPMLKQDQQSVLDAVLSLLGSGCKEVLLLWSEHYNMEEIAKALSFKSAQVAMNKKSKCFKQLLKLIEEQPELKLSLRELQYT